MKNYKKQWAYSVIGSGDRENELLEVIITADLGRQLIGAVSDVKVAEKIVREHNALLPPFDWTCSECGCDFDCKHESWCGIGRMVSGE